MRTLNIILLYFALVMPVGISVLLCWWPELFEKLLDKYILFRFYPWIVVVICLYVELRNK